MPRKPAESSGARPEPSSSPGSPLSAQARGASQGGSRESSVAPAPSSGDSLEAADGRAGPGRPIGRRVVVASLLVAAAAIGALYVLLPQITGLRETWQRIDRGDPAWLVAGVAFEALSFAAYVALFRAVFADYERRIDWRASYEITMAGLVATRLFALAGIGGIALTTWALRRSGMTRRAVASRMTAYLMLVYGVFMVALIIGGLGLRTGLFQGPAPFAITVVPAAFASCVVAFALGFAALPGDLERRIRRLERRLRVPAWLRTATAVAPAMVAEGVRGTLALVRGRPLSVVGALAWWGFDVAVLWAAFKAFGEAPSAAVIVVSYFVGMLANLLPVPGGIGGVEGGMIGALIAFGVAPGLAIVAVLSYRAISFWLPTIPGAIAYLGLRRTVHRWELEGAMHPG
jgi:uncharacterized membrane protein YbhN (UPF0104 family)